MILLITTSRSQTTGGELNKVETTANRNGRPKSPRPAHHKIDVAVQHA